MHRAAWSGAFVVLGMMVFTACSNSAAETCEGDAPSPTYLCCEGASGPSWIDPINDTNNCGACGFTCSGGQYCRIGRCEGGTVGDGGLPSGDGGSTGMCSPSCSSSQRCCGTTCISRSGVAPGADGRGDPTFQNCTACGAACDPDRASACSVAGGGTGTPQCLCGVYPQCTSGSVCALDGTEFACINTSTNPNNCGSIGNVCGANEDCIAGVCTPRMCGSVVCTATQACCGGSCVDVQSDELNCGACANACDGSETCHGGVCLCGTDAATAVACQAPMAGAFGAPGNPGQSCCDNTCVANTDTNCGCGVVCDTADGDSCQVGGSFLGGSTEPQVCCGDDSVSFLGCGGGFPFP